MVTSFSLVDFAGFKLPLTLAVMICLTTKFLFLPSAKLLA